ncbi:unnamed protein product [Arabidopsis halleri]
MRERGRGQFGGDRKGTAAHGGRRPCMHGGPRAPYPPPSRVFRLIATHLLYYSLSACVYTRLCQCLV